MAKYISLNKVYKENDRKSRIFYWNNLSGDVNLPGDDNCHLIDELPDVFQKLFDLCGPHQYMVSLDNVPGLMSVFMFDAKWYRRKLKKLNSDFIGAEPDVRLVETLKRYGQDLAKKLPDSCTVLIGISTDPCGHELCVFIPAQECFKPDHELLHEIQKMDIVSQVDTRFFAVEEEKAEDKKEEKKMRIKVFTPTYAMWKKYLQVINRKALTNGEVISSTPCPDFPNTYWALPSSPNTVLANPAKRRAYSQKFVPVFAPEQPPKNLKNGQTIPIGTMYMDGKPVPVCGPSIMEYRPGAKLTFSEPAIGPNYMIMGVYVDGVFIASRPVLSNISAQDLMNQNLFSDKVSSNDSNAAEDSPAKKAALFPADTQRLVDMLSIQFWMKWNGRIPLDTILQYRPLFAEFLDQSIQESDHFCANDWFRIAELRFLCMIAALQTCEPFSLDEAREFFRK